MEDLRDILDERERDLVAHLLGHIEQVLLVLLREYDGPDAGAMGGDDLGGGAYEAQANVAEPSERTASKSLEVLKQVASTGYMRKRLPQELVVLQGEDRNPANCNEIGRVVLPLGGSKPRNYPIDVTYEYDSNMIMHATIKDPQMDVQKSLQITQQGRLSNAEVEEKRETMQEVEVV